MGAPSTRAPPVTHAPADMPSDPAAPPAGAPTDMTTDAGKTEPNKDTAALPAGRTEPLPPKDHKPVASKEQSKRTGAMACCGAGTCGECAPLPAKRSEPIPAKDGKPVAASKSVRKGKEACCGEGTCSPC